MLWLLATSAALLLGPAARPAVLRTGAVTMDAPDEPLVSSESLSSRGGRLASGLQGMAGYLGYKDHVPVPRAAPGATPQTETVAAAQIETLLHPEPTASVANAHDPEAVARARLGSRLGASVTSSYDVSVSQAEVWADAWTEAQPAPATPLLFGSALRRKKKL